MLENTKAALHRNEHRLLGGMLVALYLALEATGERALVAALMAVHLGLFLLWQPIWQRDRPLERSSVAGIVAFTLAFVFFSNVTVLGLWQVVLIGIVAGRSFASSRERNLYLASLGLLFILLLFETVPRAFSLALTREVDSVFDALALTVAIAMLVVPVKATPTSETFPVDFFRGVTISLTTALMAATAVLVSLTRDLDYALALFFTLLALVGFLLTLSWLLSPRTGVGGLASLWEKSLLDIGTPFEQWLTELSLTAEAESDPDAFLTAALSRLTEIPWITGVELNHEGHTRTMGESGRYCVTYDASATRLTVYSKRPVGPALYLHYQLLLRLLADFHVAKCREAREAHQSHMQAVYETGARMTHDVKNLLQSLGTLTAILEREADTRDPDRLARTHALVRAQLPVVTSRLKQALDKLGAGSGAADDTRPAGEWFESVKVRTPGEFTTFELVAPAALEVPATLFDLVADNLVENIRVKRLSEPDVTARVELAGSDSDGPRLIVTDSGSPVPAHVAQRMLRQPVVSQNGFGIGLYQCAREAEAAGYALSLACNTTGEVRFELARA